MCPRITTSAFVLLLAAAAAAQVPRSVQAPGPIPLAAFQMTGVRTAADEAPAAQFNFFVPVRIENLMPAVQQVRLECRVYTTKPPRWMDDAGLVASWSEDLPVDESGSVKQTVRASFDAKPPANARDATYYQCDFRLLAQGVALIPALGSDRALTRARTGLPFLAAQEGPLVK